MTLKIVYLSLFFISFIELVIFYETTLDKINKNYLILYLTSIVANFGYTMSIFCSSLEGAMCGNLVSYIGSIFTILFMLTVTVDMCKKRFYTPFRIFLLVYALAISIVIATTQNSNLFLKHPYIVQENGITVIKYDFGIGMFFYIAYLAIINLSAMITVIHSIKTKKRVSTKTLKFLLCALILGTLIYVVPLSLGYTINLMPFIYVFMETFFIYISSRMHSYDLALNLVSVYKERGGYGYIAFDNKKNLLGCDEFAIQIFPDLDAIPIDSAIPQRYTDLMNKLHINDSSWNWDEHCDKDFKILTTEKAAIGTIHRITSNFNYRIGYLIELRDDTEQQNYIKGINSFNKELSHLIEEKTQQVTDMQDSIIKGMAIMVEGRDNSTGGHILRTSDCVKIFAEELLKHKEIPQITPSFCRLLIKAAPMHDLGKITIDDSILRKPGKYTADEYEIMKTHAAEGAKIVRKILNETSDQSFKCIAINIAHYHHEKWNGEGYPEHLQGIAIPLEARIMALADVFDALVSKRCYKDAKSFDEAFEIIKKNLGKHFDPVIGKIFIDCRQQLEEYYSFTMGKAENAS